MLKVMIADSSEDFCRTLSEKLQGMYRLCACHEGTQAEAMLSGFQPDLLVLDLMMPGLDGICLLQKLWEQGYRIPVLVTTRYVNDYIIRAIERFQVGYMMVKPCDMKSLVMRITDMTRCLCGGDSGEPDAAEEVKDILRRLGFAAHHGGCGCLEKAIMLYRQDPAQQMTKMLYPTVGRLCGSSAEQVERSMRTAITAAWKRGDHTLWSRYFPMDSQGKIRKPTNSAFIARIAQELDRIDAVSGTAGSCVAVAM
ncbi:MAG: response regulator [Oscillospiraceae bacterium]|nr:response regulator [Oscillospiraceae bacterium]